jgi:outer membrane protein TolC
MNDKPIYKVIATHEAPELSTIEKSNITAEITLADTLRSIEQNRKAMESIQAELKLKKALIQNVVNNYPDVVNIDEKMQIACHTYYEANRYIAIAEEKLAEFEEAQVDLKEEVDEIAKQTGVTKMTEERRAEIQANIKKMLEEDPDIINEK